MWYNHWYYFFRRNTLFLIVFKRKNRDKTAAFRKPNTFGSFTYLCQRYNIILNHARHSLTWETECLFFSRNEVQLYSFQHEIYGNSSQDHSLYIMYNIYKIVGSEKSLSKNKRYKIFSGLKYGFLKTYTFAMYIFRTNFFFCYCVYLECLTKKTHFKQNYI